MMCPICAGEFGARVELCPQCGCDLVSSVVGEPRTNVRTSERSEHTGLVELCRPRSFPVAMLIKQVLEQNSVVALVKGGHSLSVLPHLAASGELRILVSSEQLEFASAIYRAYFESEDDTDYLTDSSHETDD